MFNTNFQYQKEIKPTQENPSPEYPVLHVQIKLPFVFLQVASL